ncbi:MAG TPA: hypothetical protein VJB70_02260 [Candidatus Paceibacterota bacterium]
MPPALIAKEDNGIWPVYALTIAAMPAGIGIVFGGLLLLYYCRSKKNAAA